MLLYNDLELPRKSVISSPSGPIFAERSGLYYEPAGAIGKGTTVSEDVSLDEGFFK